MVAASKEITLKDIGRPKSLRIPIPEDGGIVVLTGPNGAGKSTTLDAIQDGITNRKEKKSRPRDGIAIGSLSGCGIQMTVGRKITRTGELTVETLDGGRLSIADVVSPPYKGAEEADGRRIKALVQLAGVEADSMLFRDLHPAFKDVIEDDSLAADDILVMADRIKRDFEKAARSAEGMALIEERHALACEESTAGVDFAVEADANKLQAAFQEAVRKAQALTSQADEANRRNAEILAARQKITEITLARPGERRVSLDDARFRETDARNRLADSKAEYERLEDQLRAAQRNLMRAEEQWEDAKRELGQTERFLESVAELEKTVATGELPVPTDLELDAAGEAVTAARKAIESGSAVRKAQETMLKAEGHREKQGQYNDKAVSLRQAAAGVDMVLTQQIATLGCPLRVEAGRLLTDTDRGPTFYAELSDGERWKMAVEIAVKAVGRGGLLAIPQAAWGELQPKVRGMLDKIAKDASVVILTAQATDDDDIQAVPFEEMEVATA